jgi:hypothetical protein
VNAEPVTYFYSVGPLVIGLAALALLTLAGWMVFKK